MTPDGRLKLKNLLLQDEGYKQFVYTDITGNLTVGIGRCLTTRGVTLTESLYLLDEDIKYFTQKLEQVLPLFEELSEARQIVLIDMCFNLGLQGLLSFRDMIDALSDKDYAKASEAILDSKVARDQNTDRYYRLASIMKSGEI